jgi:hypothetical protein
MAIAGPKIQIVKSGKGLGLHFPLRFADEWDIKKDDYALPCIQENKHMKDDNIGRDGYELIFKFRKKQTKKLFDILIDMDGDVDE